MMSTDQRSAIIQRLFPFIALALFAMALGVLQKADQNQSTHVVHKEYLISMGTAGRNAEYSDGSD